MVLELPRQRVLLLEAGRMIQAPMWPRGHGEHGGVQPMHTCKGRRGMALAARLALARRHISRIFNVSSTKLCHIASFKYLYIPVRGIQQSTNTCDDRGSIVVFSISNSIKPNEEQRKNWSIDFNKVLFKYCRTIYRLYNSKHNFMKR